MIKEAKRLQQLAGIKEIEVNVPSRKLFDAEINFMDQSDNGVYMECSIKPKYIELPVIYGYSEKTHVSDPYDYIYVDLTYLNTIKIGDQLIAYLNKYKVKYEIKTANELGEHETIMIPAKHFNIINS